VPEAIKNQDTPARTSVRCSRRPPGERPVRADRLGRTLQVTVSTDRADSTDGQHLELPVEELLRRARPLPPRNEMVIEDLTEEEGEAFLAAIEA
jgi:hypothetical protein